MSEDRRRPGQYASRRDEALRSWLADDVYPYSSSVRSALDAAGLGRRGVRTAADLRRLPITAVADLGDGRDRVLAPTEALVHQYADLVTRGRLLVADAAGGRREFVRSHIDEPYKPVAWTLAPAPGQVLFTASTRTDLDHLAALGRRALSISGVRPDDRVLCTPAVGVGPLQLAEGCRDAGVAALQADPAWGAGLVVEAAPTVLAGSPRTLRRLAADGLPPSVRLLLVHASTTAQAAAARRFAPRLGVPVSVWWSPAGTRAAWASCPGSDGFHTWPAHELLEAVDDAGRHTTEGHLVWSAVGWHGSVWVRVALGVAGRLDDRPCRCGRTTPRVHPDLPGSPAS